jgi:iron complex transport system permease protein
VKANSRPRLSGGRIAFHCTVGTAVAVALALLIPLVGGGISLREALSAWPWRTDGNWHAVVFWQTRIPRVLLALMAGGALAVAGLVFQAVLRNPLAEPYILGISGGAALGKTLAVVIAVGGDARFFALMSLFCFAGALAPVALLQAVAAAMRRFSSVTILLIGVMLNVFFSALILLLQYFADFTQVRQLFLWMMGGLDVVGYGWLLSMLPFLLICFAAVVAHSRAMNVLSVDVATAAHLGVDVKRTVTHLIWAGSLLTGIVVALSGPIGFVGLIVPHSLRLVFGSDNRLLAPLCLIYGGVFLLLCDFVGWRGMELLQMAGLPIAQATEIPVGVITAILGGPFFLYLLLSRRRMMRE